MNLELIILSSTSIKRKRPWPKIVWLGRDQGTLYLLDKRRVRQLHLASGNSCQKIPSLQPFLVDVQALATSSNGRFLVGALKSGKLFVWDTEITSLRTTPVLEKIRNSFNSNVKRINLFISNCGKKVILLYGFDQLFLWETEDQQQAQEPLKGRWMQIQDGDCKLPSDQDKESVIDGVFYEDNVHGLCCLVSWVFNNEDKVCITTLRVQWSPPGVESIFSVKWFIFCHPLYGLIPAQRVLKSSKAYVARFSPDGQILAVAMNQKSANDTRMLFYSTTSSSVAAVTNLKGSGSKSVKNLKPTGRLWWICDQQWTKDSLFVIIITKCGGVAILTKLGEPVLINTLDGELGMTPSLYLPLHPRLIFKKENMNSDDDGSLSLHSNTDDTRHRYSISVHPNLPIFLTTDGYAVTILQLPSNASYTGVMTSLTLSVSRLVPEVKEDPAIIPMPPSTSKVNIFQSDTNLSKSTKDLGETSLSSSSSFTADFGLASGCQGMAVIPIITDLQEDEQTFSWKLNEAQNNCLKALAVGLTSGKHWTKSISKMLSIVIKCVLKLFNIYLQDTLIVPSESSLKTLSRFKSSKLAPGTLKNSYDYFKVILEIFLWDSSYRNAFTLSLLLVHGFVKEILSCKRIEDSQKVGSCLAILELAENILEFVYSWKQSTKTSLMNDVIDQFSPNKSIPASRSQTSHHSVYEEIIESDESTLQESCEVSKALSATWLALYDFTVQSSKRNKGSATSYSKQLTFYLCDIQKKLQSIDVTIPSDVIHQQRISAKSMIELDDSLHGIIDSPRGSLFGRRRANLVDNDINQSTPTQMQKTASLDHLFNVSSIGKSPSTTTDTQGKADTASLLAILYLNLQNYNLKAAFQLVLSLMEPAPDNLDKTFSILFTLDSLQATHNKDYSTSQLLTMLLQTYPIIRVADKCGIPVVQSLGRFMAAYFSNLSLYVFPAYLPNVLPPCYLGRQSRHESTSEESFTISQGSEIIYVERARVAQAVRDQGISDVWCANNTIELMLISGLIGEAAWLSNNLGDWKHALILSFSHTFNQCLQTEIPKTMLTSIPSNLTPENIILQRLQPVLTSTRHTIPKHLLDAPDDATTTPNKERVLIERPIKDNKHHHVDTKINKDTSNLLEASMVAGIDVVPILCEQMLQNLLELVSDMDWIVPDELYLPAPPLFCPQPYNVESELVPPHVFHEKQLRADIAKLVQNLLALLHSSNCMAPCIQWYVSQLISANEKWYGNTIDDQDFIVPKSLSSHTEIALSFHAADASLQRVLKRHTIKSKDVPSPPRPSKTPGSSVDILREFFHQFCSIMWSLYVRDKMSLCARKYRKARNQLSASPQMTNEVERLCWETIQWTLQLQPFGSLLGSSAQVSDSLLTLLSEMQPSIVTAEITAQYFSDLNLITTTSGRAKYKRLMAQFRGITLQDAGSIVKDTYDKPLSVYYREKCLEWQDELRERERLFNNIQLQMFTRDNNEDDSGKHSFILNKGHSCVGSLLFETSHVFLEFLDTFFAITFTKTASEMPGQASIPVPLLLPYEKILTFSEAKVMKDLQVRAATDKDQKRQTVNMSLHRSQSCVDIRSYKPSQPHSQVQLDIGKSEIKRSNSMSDINKQSRHSGLNVLGTRLLDVIPRLLWLSRWSSEGLPSTSIETRTTEGQPAMKVDVELPFLLNSLWLLSNVYIPWELNDQVKSPIEISQSPLKRAFSESSLSKLTAQSPTTEEDRLIKNEKERYLRMKTSKELNQQHLVLSREQKTDSRDSKRDSTHPKARLHKKPTPVRRALKLNNEGTSKIRVEERVEPCKESTTKESNSESSVTADDIRQLASEKARSFEDKREQCVHKVIQNGLKDSDGVESFALRQNNGNTSKSSEVALMKLSTMTSNQDDVKTKTDKRNSHNPSNERIARPATVDFSAQYDECREVSCQTITSDRNLNQPAKPYGDHSNHKPSSNEVHSNPQTYFNRLPFNHQSFSDLPRFKDSLQHRNLKDVWPEQHGEHGSMSFPLLHLKTNLHSSNEHARNAPPFTGFSLHSQQKSNDTKPFKLLTLPQQTSEHHSAKSFRLLELSSASRDLPLLQIPKTSDSNQQRPDLSRIKFADVLPTRSSCAILKKCYDKPSHALRENHVIGQSEIRLLHATKEKSKPMLIPAEALDQNRDITLQDKENKENIKENLKPKKIRDRKRKRPTEAKKHTPQLDVRSTPSRQRRRQKMVNEMKKSPENTQVDPASLNEMKTKQSQMKNVITKLDEGLSEESELELSDEEQLYFNLNSSKTRINNEQVEEYCREIENRVKKKFDQELDTIRRKQMEVEVNERVRREMEKLQEQEEIRKRLEQERQLQEKIEREKKAMEDKLQKKVPSPVPSHDSSPRPPISSDRSPQLDIYNDSSSRPVPRERSVKCDQVSFPCHTNSTNSVKLQSKVRDAVDKNVQTNESESEFKKNGEKILDQPSFAPVLPPHVLLGLNLDEEKSEQTKSSKFASRESQYKNGKHFVSVADIDHELWVKIGDGIKMTNQQNKQKVQPEEEEESANENECSVSQTQEDINQSKNEDEFSTKSHDSLTVQLMESIERSQARNTKYSSKVHLSNRLQEMNERFEAIDKLSQNMDREFQSSTVLLNAIESIGDIMSPTLAKPAQNQSRISTSSRKKQDTAPWRMNSNTEELSLKGENDFANQPSASGDNEQQSLHSNADSNSSASETSDVNSESKRQSHDQDDQSSDKYESFDKRQSHDQDDQSSDKYESFDNRQSHDQNDQSSDKYESFDAMTSATNLHLEPQKAGQEKDKPYNESEDEFRKKSTSEAHKESWQKITLSSDKLKEIFGDIPSHRTSDTTKEKSRKVQDWMARKRKERHSQWKNKVEELRAAEFKPFATVAKGPSNMKKLKMTENERQTKRRNRQETQTDERLKEASHLINEMLAEPIPKGNVLQNLHYTPPPPKNKNRRNNRYSENSTAKNISKKIPNVKPNSNKNKLRSNKDIKKTAIDDRRGHDTRHIDGGRSITPSGSDFVTTKTFRIHEKEKLRKTQKLERYMDTYGVYVANDSLDINDLMEEIPDGSTISDLNDIDELLSDDSELKELLTDVLPYKRNTSSKRERGVPETEKSRGTLSRKLRTHYESQEPKRVNVSRTRQPNDVYETDHFPSNQTYRPATDQDLVSPWNSADGLKMSDDVAQLLAEAKQVIGDSMSESSASIMSNIDWDAVDKIMNDI